MNKLTRIASIKEIPPGQSKIVKIGEFGIALFNINGEIYALENCCPHSGAPLGKGSLEGTVVTCPLHQWRFDVTNGISMDHPEEKVKRYDVKVENGIIKVLL